MGLFRKIFNRTPRWSYPESQYLEVPPIDPAYNEAVEVSARSDASMRFHVNLYKLTCTCPKFLRMRSRFASRDVRRICPHLAEALQRAKLDGQMSDALVMVMRHGRKFMDFHRVRLAMKQADVVFGFSRESSLIGVYAVIGSEQVAQNFDLADQRWDGFATRVDDVLLPEIERVFETRPRLKVPRSPRAGVGRVDPAGRQSRVSQPSDAEDPALKERLIELETKFAYLEKTVETLNDVVTRQQRELEYLEKRLSALRAQVSSPLNIPDENPAE